MEQNNAWTKYWVFHFLSQKEISRLAIDTNESLWRAYMEPVRDRFSYCFVFIFSFLFVLFKQFLHNNHRDSNLDRWNRRRASRTHGSYRFDCKNQKDLFDPLKKFLYVIPTTEQMPATAIKWFKRKNRYLATLYQTKILGQGKLWTYGIKIVKVQTALFNM